MWNAETEDIKTNYITTIYGHKGAILALAFCKTKAMLVSSSTDKTVRIWKMDDNFDKIKNPFFVCTSVIRDFKLKPAEKTESLYWVNTLSIKESDNIELYAGDTNGNIHIYSITEQHGNYGRGMETDVRYASSTSTSNQKKSSDSFVYQKTISVHKMTVVKVTQSMYDNMIFSIGFDSLLVGYNHKDKKSKKIYFKKEFLELPNGNKSFFTSITLNHHTHELICGDDKGNVSFIKIYNKSQVKLKPVNNRAIYIQFLELFQDNEHLLIVTEDGVNIFKIKRDIKTLSVTYHTAEIVKVFVIEPVKKDKKILEDAK
jgi:WD40 repeat protein